MVLLLSIKPNFGKHFQMAFGSDVDFMLFISNMYAFHSFITNELLLFKLTK